MFYDHMVSSFWITYSWSDNNDFLIVSNRDPKVKNEILQIFLEILASTLKVFR